MVRLGDAFVLQMGKTPDRQNQNYWNNASNKWISIADITKDKYICNTKESISDIAVCESGIKAIPPNTVIMSFKLSIGKVCITKDKVYSNEAIMAFLPNNPNNIDISFLYYRLLSHNWTLGINKAVKGITLNKVSLNNTRILFPTSILHQRKIAQILDKASELIEKRKKQLHELDRLAESVFYDMFGDPVTNPKGWKLDCLKKHLKVIGGYAFKSTAYVEEGIPILRIGNINSGILKIDNVVFYEKQKNLNRYIVRPNDIVISLTGTVGKEDYGNICILDDTYSYYYLNQRNAKLELNSTIDKWYLALILKNQHIKSKLTGISRGVRQANISNSDIENIVIPIAPTEHQHQFASIIEKIEAQKAKVKAALKESEDLFMRLMQDMFNPEYHEK